jgi:tetratricopeptide (TPR) repeat protein
MSGKIPPKDQVAEIENLVRLYGALKAGKVLPPDEMTECHDNAADMSAELAKQWHSESVTTKNGDKLPFVDKLYNVYLKHFPDAADYGTTQYYYAELLWTRALYETNPRVKTELWENAAVEFTAVVKGGKVDDKLMKVAAEAAVMGWKNALDVDPRKKLESKPEEADAYDKVPEPLPIPEREQKMIAAFDVYIDYIKDKKDPELVAMKFNKANLFRRYNRFDEALALFDDILTNHRDHETALYSANLMLDSLNRLQRYDQMLKWVDTLLADEKWLTKDDDQADDKEALKETLEALKRQSLRKRAEQVTGEAEKSKDIKKFVACGDMYTEIYNRDENAADADEVLYNAGYCYEQGKSLGAAIPLFKALIEKFGKDEKGRDTKNVHAQKALLRLGAVYARVGYYDKAADFLGQYGLKFPDGDPADKTGESKKQSRDAVSDSVFYLKGIGSDDAAIAQTKRFVDTFGKKNPKEAATAFFSLFSIYEKRGDTDALIKHLYTYVNGPHGKAGGADTMIMAYGKLGQALWKKSCGVSAVEGSCVKVTRDRALASLKKGKKKRTLQTQCGPESKVKTTVIGRDARFKKEALAAFAKAASIYEARKPSGDVPADAAALYWYATAKFHQLDEQYETYLGMPFPTGLDFSDQMKVAGGGPKSKKSMATFNAWLTKKQAMIGTLKGGYLAIIKLGDPSMAVAASARIGQVAQNYTDALYTAEIPEAQRKIPEAVEGYCDALVGVAEPAEALSIEGFTACLENSTRLGYFSEWSRLCERELGQIQPDRFPTAAEIREEPNGVSTVTSVELPDVTL